MKIKRLFEDEQNKAVTFVIVLALVFGLVLGMSLTGVLSENNKEKLEIQTTEGDTAYLIYEGGELTGVDTSGDGEVDDDTSEMTLWGSTKISDSHIGTELLALNDNGEITFGNGQEVSITYDTATQNLEFNGADLSGIGSLDAEQVSITEFYPQFEDENIHSGDGQRPLVSKEDVDMYVDPTNGDDSNPGTESEPIATLEEASKRQPIILFHAYHVILSEGTYTTRYDCPPFISNRKPRPDSDEWIPFQIRSKDTADRDNVIIDHTLNLNGFHGEQDFPAVKDVRMDATLLMKMGNIQVRNVNFTGLSENVLPGEVGIGVDVHAPAHIYIKDCEFGYNLLDGIKVSQGATAEISITKGRTQRYAVQVAGGATAIFRDNCRDFWGDRGQWYTKNGGRVYVGDTPFVNNPFLYDDFGDGGYGKTIADERVKSGGFRNYYPDWDTYDTSDHEIKDGYLEIPSGKNIVKSYFMMTEGIIEVDFSFNSTPSSNRADLKLMDFSGGGLIQIIIQSSGELKLQVVDDEGNIENTIVGTWDVDDETHRIRLVKTSSGHELYYDGDLVGSDSNTYVSNVGDHIKSRIVNSCDTNLHLEKIVAVQDNG